VQLEEALGAPLSGQGHRGVTLTEDGQRLFEAVRDALNTIRAATAEIRARLSARHPTRGHAGSQCVPSMATGRMRAGRRIGVVPDALIPARRRLASIRTTRSFALLR
jgi:DNA-binding transcriptional LysR family regulator